MNGSEEVPSPWRGHSQPRPTHCLNCTQPVEHAYCAHCGQENHDYRESLWPLVGDLADELFQLESRLWRSLATLLLRPGKLTVEYNAGRRVRYTSPLRLYLLLGGLYFFVGAVVPSNRLVPIQVKVADNGASTKPTPRWLKPLADKGHELQKLDGAEVARRMRPSLESNTPRAFALLVPVFALLLKLFYRRRFYVEHLVFALHTTAFSFVLMLPERWLHSGVFTTFSLVAWAAYMALAQRRVHGESWLRTLAKLTGIIMLLFVCGVLVILPVVIVAFLNA